MFKPFLWVLAVLSIVGCSHPSADMVTSTSHPIVDGTRAAGNYPAVVLVLNRAGGMCTGSLIAPRVVLTAKHCVQSAEASEPTAPGYFVVGIGDSLRGLTRSYSVQAVRTTPGVYTSGRRGLDGALVGIDVALLTLTQGATIEPLGIHRENPRNLVRDEVRSVGFGQIPSGSSGVKYHTTTTVSGIMGNVIYSGPTICQGDSGGPLMTLDGEVFGVASFGSGGCGSGLNGYNNVYGFLDMIDEVVADSGACLNNGEEVCDSYDNDCDDAVDEGCADVGDPCADSDDCVGGSDAGPTCQDSLAGRICTVACDGLRPAASCTAGFYCAVSSGCEGQCIPGSAGGRPYDETCEEDTDCMSLKCIDPGDGRRRCLTPCEGDAGRCLAGEACVANPGECGGCVDAEILVALRGLGEPCAADGECRSGICFSDAEEAGYCSRDCDSDEACADGYHCRVGEPPRCVRGNREGIGSSCRTNEDCHEGGFCATLNGVSWCTDFCPPVECPDGYSCVDVGDDLGLCAPASGLTGARCETAEDCLSGLCAETADGTLCTRYCGPDAPCGPGFECQRTEDGASAICVPSQAEPNRPESGGCAVGQPRSQGAGAWAALLLIGFAWWSRRRLKGSR